MLQAYVNHVAERAALGIPPLPLSAEQTSALVELLKNPSAAEADFLLDLITHRVPAGVDDAAKVKAKVEAEVKASGVVHADPDRVNVLLYVNQTTTSTANGGEPQVAAALRALDELGVEDVAVVGLAKRLEEVWLPGDDFPVVLPRTSPGLYLLQRLRDEAHRFAIGTHRAKRKREMTRNPLDEIPGIGPTRKRALLHHFGTVKAIQSAALEDLMKAPGVNAATARAVYDFFHERG